MSEETVGRNEPCPCGSGKKYKRCCGVSAAPKLTPPKNLGPAMPEGMPDFDPNSLDPNLMMQLSQALQRLPKGQMQRFQSLMQKAMNGKDISREAQEFEKTLPVELQSIFAAFGAMNGMGAPDGAPSGAMPAGEMPMTEGTIDSAQPAAEPNSRFSKLWRSIKGK